ncbi:hypothetical protein F7R02_24670, partial [Xanthomonas cissicola]
MSFDDARAYLSGSRNGVGDQDRYMPGFTPVFTDTYKKADQGHEECSCQSAGSSLPSSSVARLSRPAS